MVLLFLKLFLIVGFSLKIVEKVISGIVSAKIKVSNKANIPFIN